MNYLTDEQFRELSDSSLKGLNARLVRANDRTSYNLIEYRARGMKSAVWLVTDAIGRKAALKIVPPDPEADWNLLDEMTHASKLDPDYFAQVLAFGDFELWNGSKQINLSTNYKAVTTVWVDGPTFDAFAHSTPLTGEEFLNLATQLFTVLAVLRNNGLCHDDLHPGNVLVERINHPLRNEPRLAIKVIDTGAVKRLETRERLLSDLRKRIAALEENHGASEAIARAKDLLGWKEPDDHLRIIESLLHAANSLAGNYHRLSFWERAFVDQLLMFIQRATDLDLTRRLDDPEQLVTELLALVSNAKAEETKQRIELTSPFDYISAEMIRNDREFAELFSRECPWLNECRSLEPLYIYGPRGCGKSSVLRWLSLKTLLSDPKRSKAEYISDIGVYVSCSVELRSRFWLLAEDIIDELQTPIIRFFNLLLLEELFETMLLMWRVEETDGYQFGFHGSKLHDFTAFALQRIRSKEDNINPRLQGQSPFDYLRSAVRKLRWETWSQIQNGDNESRLPDPSLASDICRSLSHYFRYFESRHVTFLIDDYSNQRIPRHLQRKLNQTISFAKQGTPIFKVSSEYNGVDLEGIQEGREVVEINIGDQYTSLTEPTGPDFLADIVNIRLNKAGYSKPSIEGILGRADYNMAAAIADESELGPFYYFGIDCIHWLCSGDVALALDLIKRIFDGDRVSKTNIHRVSNHLQHRTIQKFSHDEIHRIKSIVPYGEEMHEVVVHLGLIARAVVMGKRSKRKDKLGQPVCMTHLDVRIPVITELQTEQPPLFGIYGMLTSRAILVSLDTSRSRIEGSTERLQMRRIYFPSFKAPITRDVPIKIDALDELISMLKDPQTFADREIKKAALDVRQLELAREVAIVKPRGK